MRFRSRGGVRRRHGGTGVLLGYEAYQALYRSLLIIHTARYGLIYVSHELRLSCGLDLRARMMTKHV